MARIKAGSAVAEVHGSVGSVTFQTGPYGLFCHTRQKRRVGARQRVLAPGVVWGSVIRAWNDLTPGQRAAWDHYTTPPHGWRQRGGGVEVSGRAAFQSVAMLGAVVEAGIPDAPPCGPMPAPVTEFSAVGSAAGQSLELTFLPDPVPAGSGWVLWWAVLGSRGTHVPASGWRLAGYLPGGTPSGVDAGSIEVAQFGTLLEGQGVRVRMLPVAVPGLQVGSPIECSCVIGA